MVSIRKDYEDKLSDNELTDSRSNDLDLPSPPRLVQSFLLGFGDGSMIHATLDLSFTSLLHAFRDIFGILQYGETE